MEFNGVPYVFCDGSATPKRSGFGVYLGSEIPSISIEVPKGTTNSRCELLAMLEAMKYIEAHNIHGAHIISDSSYVVKSINEWIPKWLENGWLTTKGTPVAHRDILEEIYIINARIGDVVVKHHLAHQKRPSENESELDKFLWTGNMMADRLARNSNSSSNI